MIDRLAVLVSGNGTNLQALVDATADPGFGASIVVVVSDRPDAYALTRAEAAGIPTEVVPWSPDRTRSTKAVIDVFERYEVKGVVLAGFMRILGPAAIRRYPNRIINVHPSLLPSFAGSKAIEAALAHGVKVTGVTVHFVDEEVDHGPIIAQEPVVVEPGDDVESLAARIHIVEHVLLPAVVGDFVAGRLSQAGVMSP